MKKKGWSEKFLDWYCELPANNYGRVMTGLFFPLMVLALIGITLVED